MFLLEFILYIHFSYLIVDDYNNLNAGNDLYLFATYPMWEMFISNLVLLFYLCFMSFPKHVL